MSTPGRTVMITGAARGLGRAIAGHLAAPGTRLLLHYGHSADTAREVLAAVHAAGAEAVLLQADLSRLEERERLMNEVTGHCDGLHLLVNNAAVYPEAGVEGISPEQWRTVLEINCGAVFHLLSRAVPLLRAAAAAERRARVINLGDSGADRVVARPMATPYHVSKLGVHVLTRTFAKTLAPDGINVNMVSPGFLEASVGAPGSDMPAGRRGRYEDILGAIDYLLSPAAEYVSGANVVVSGGWNA